MDLKRPAPDGIDQPSTSAPVKKKKVDSGGDPNKIERLMNLYRLLGHELKKLNEREIDFFGDNYDEEAEEKATRRYEVLAKKRLKIHKYLTRKGLLLDEGEHTLNEDIDGEDERIMITSTGIERLNDLLTDFVNKSGEKKEFQGVLGEHRYLTSDDVTRLFDQLQDEQERKMLPEHPEECERFVTNIVLTVNREVKNYLERKHAKSLRELWSADEVLNGPTSNEEASPENPELAGPSKIPAWEEANLEMIKACAGGELAVSGEPGSEEFETNMPETEAELDEEEEEDEESLTVGSSEVDGILDEDEETIEIDEGRKIAQEPSNEAEEQGKNVEGAEGNEEVTEVVSTVECNGQDEASTGAGSSSERSEDNAREIEGANDVQEIENTDDVENGVEEVADLGPLEGDVEVIASDDEGAEDADRTELAGSSPPILLLSEDSSSSSIILLD